MSSSNGNKLVGWLCILIGVAVIALNLRPDTKYDDASANMACATMVAGLYECYGADTVRPVVVKVAGVLKEAVAARQGNPAKLADDVKAGVLALGLDGTSSVAASMVVVTVCSKVNEAYSKHSDCEDDYLARVNALADGLLTAAAASE